MQRAPKQPDRHSLRQLQRRTVLLCFLAYTVSYLCRTNLSVVLTPLGQDLGASRSMLGMAGTVFFWTYALGQLISGGFAQRLNAKNMVFLGLLCSLCCNLLIGLCRSYLLLTVLWGLNGFALSMIWSSIVRICSSWFTSGQYGQVSVIISLPTTVGYVLSWGITGLLISFVSWRWAFFLPAACTLIFLIFWMFMVRNFPEEFDHSLEELCTEEAETGGPGAPAAEAPAKPAVGLLKILFSFTMIITAIICMVQGAVKESINLWTPTILGDLAGEGAGGLVSMSSILVPVIGTVGILLSSWIDKKSKGRSNISLFLLSALLLALSLGLIVLQRSFFGSVGVISAIMAVLYCINVITTAIVPLKFAHTGRSAQLSGILNFLTYLGAALGSMFTGIFSDAFGWNGAFFLWAGLCLLAFAAVVFSLFERKKV
ncbi:MFS transporter [Provencibacterium massiliense]|uniref:MFS transporter n=1 Tax=Provencibacterium massiliense TaxID=1841868 RepID=UPI0013564E58|nr:MFS transporter [Provencibacterium massiliense]